MLSSFLDKWVPHSCEGKWTGSSWAQAEQPNPRLLLREPGWRNFGFHRVQCLPLQGASTCICSWFWMVRKMTYREDTSASIAKMAPPAQKIQALCSHHSSLPRPQVMSLLGRHQEVVLCGCCYWFFLQQSHKGRTAWRRDGSDFPYPTASSGWQQQQVLIFHRRWKNEPGILL